MNSLAPLAKLCPAHALTLAAALAMGLPSSAHAESGPLPNVVIIYADTLTQRAIRFMP